MMENIVRSVHRLPRLSTAPTGQDAARDFAIAWAVALRRYGTPVHRLEAAGAELARELDLQLRIYVLPTSILAQDDRDGRTFLQPVQGGPATVERMAAAEAIARRVASGETSATAGLAALRTIDKDPGPWPQWVMPLAGGATSAAAAAFLGGGAIEVGVAAVVGLVCLFLAGRLASGTETVRLVDLLSGLVAALLISSIPVPFARDVAVLAALVFFLPGYSLTTAFADLATGHLLAGATGLIAAMTTLLHLGLGVAIGSRLGQLAFGVPQIAPPEALSPWAMPVVLASASLSFAVLLQVRLRWVGWVAAACVVAVVGAHVGSSILGNPFGVLGGSLGVAMLGALAARSGLPLAVTQVPGLLILVPGSIGFRAMQALIAQDVQGGIEAVTTTALAATALVGGSLLGQALLPPRREL